MFSTRSRLIDCSARTIALRLSKTGAAGVLAASLALSIAVVPATAAPGATDPSTTSPSTVTPTASPDGPPALAPTTKPANAPELKASPSPSMSPSATPTKSTATADPNSELSPEAAQKLADQMGTLGSSMGQGARKKAENINPQAPVPAGRSLLAAPQADTMAKAFMPGGVQGLDVSGWQTTDAAHSASSVNWSQQYAMGARFMYAKATEGNNFADASFSSQYTGATNAGLLRGAYHFALPGQSSAVAQADFFVNNGGGWTGDGKSMPPLLDIEYNPYSALGNTCYNFSQSAMVTWIKDFSNRVNARTGRLPMIYTTTDWWTQCTGNSSAFSNQPLHLAAYSTVLGALPNSWTFQSVWQYSSTGPFAGDSNAWNGTEASLKAFATKADSTPPPVAPPAVAPSIPSTADVVAADASGVLWDYPASGQGGFGARKKIGTSGWTGLRSINVIDWNADGVLDVVAQWNSGSVTLYKGLLSGGFAQPVTLVSSGWGNYQLTIGYWLNASMYPQILSRSNTGDLRLWKNNSGAGLDTGTVIGTGWGAMNLTMLDFDGDGSPDILAQDPSGSVRLYRSNGAGNFINETRKTVATGWNAYTSVTVYSNFTAANSLGLIRRTPAGALSYVAVPGNSTFGTGSTIGSGWNGFLIAGAETINTASPVTPPPVVAPKPTPSIASVSDIVSVDGAGKLWRYPAANAKMGTPNQIGSGFTKVKSVHVADWNADGILDLIVQWADGRLSLYKGTPAGGFASAVALAGSGWAGYDITVGQWIKGGKFPSIIAQAADGSLTSFTTSNGTSLTPGTTIAQGLTRMHPVMTDFDGDGNADIVAVNNIGQLMLYRSNGMGALIAEPRKTIGNGWNGMTSVGAANALTSAGSTGLLARTASGTLMYYPTAKSSFGTASTLATGWNGNTVAGSARLAAQQSLTSVADVLAADANGILWNYAATGGSAVAAPYPVGVGWKALKSLHVVDWNADGIPDILAQWKNGAMSVYPGAQGGGFGSPIIVAGYGWGAINFVAGNWVKGSKYPGLVGTNGQGDLYYWPNATGRTLSAAQKIGIGWGSLSITLQDFDGDGKQDVLAVDKTGAMRLYRSNGAGSFVSEPRKIIGGGWTSFKQFSGVGGFAGAGSRGVLAILPNGQTRYYPINANGVWGAPANLSQNLAAPTISR